MNLTVGNLRKIISELEDDVILADLEYGNEKFYPHDWIKRLLLLEDENGQQYLAINRMGAHYTGEGEQEGVKYKDKYWDEESVLKISCNPVLSDSLLAFAQFIQSDTGNISDSPAQWVQKFMASNV